MLVYPTVDGRLLRAIQRAQAGATFLGYAARDQGRHRYRSYQMKPLLEMEPADLRAPGVNAGAMSGPTCSRCECWCHGWSYVIPV